MFDFVFLPEVGIYFKEDLQSWGNFRLCYHILPKIGDFKPTYIFGYVSFFHQKLLFWTKKLLYFKENSNICTIIIIMLEFSSEIVIMNEKLYLKENSLRLTIIGNVRVLWRNSVFLVYIYFKVDLQFLSNLRLF